VMMMTTMGAAGEKERKNFSNKLSDFFRKRRFFIWIKTLSLSLSLDLSLFVYSLT